ncbi:hypothetical protein Ddc_14078 [Ditylenchus destructor]|nr:hypothetical protein Ddc_14078 [Ditylenchus destructor]
MSCSKPLPPFVCDSLYYLNRNQLERFSIACRPLKNFIERYLHSKPYRVFDGLPIRGGDACYLIHNEAQELLASEYQNTRVGYHSLAEMRRFLDQTVRIEQTWIAADTTYNPEHIEQMESLAHIWSDRKIGVWKLEVESQIVANDIQLILDSPTILQCRCLTMAHAHFSFKDYKVLYSAKIIEIGYFGDATDCDYWPQFLEQPGAKPLVVLRYLHRESINSVVDHLSKVFSSAVSPNAFKIVFAKSREALTEFRMTNNASGEKLELKVGLPTEYQDENLDGRFNYTLECCSI